MSFLRNKWILIALLTLCWAIATSFLAGYYYLQYNDLSAKVRGVIISASLGIDYGNGSGIIWHNETRMNAGSTLLNLTKLVAHVNYTKSLSGASIDAIDGVSNSYPSWWMWWSSSTNGWVLGSVACDRYVVGENETLLWYFQDITTYPPTPPP